MDLKDYDELNFIQFAEDPFSISTKFTDFDLNSYNHKAPHNEQSVRQLEQYIYDSLVTNAHRTCLNIKLACVRHIVDTYKSKDPSYPYIFSPNHAMHVIKFYSNLVHVKAVQGKFELLPWQIFVLGSIFGWVNKVKHPLNGRHCRRFNIANIFVARKNGKSTLACGITLYMLLMDKELGPEVYTCAPSGQQSRYLFKDARSMLLRSVFAKLPIVVNENEIKSIINNGVFVPKNAKAGNLDSLNSHFVCVDEIHSFKTSDVYDVMRTSIGSRTNPLFMVISTAGTNLGCIGHEVFQLSEAIVKGTVLQSDFENTFSAVFTIDTGDDPSDPNTWAKANPSLGAARSEDEILKLWNTAKNSPSARPNFFTKYLNVFVQGSQKWLQEEQIQRTLRVNLKLDEFIGSKIPCYVGVDVGATQDLTAIAYVFVDDRNNQLKVTAFTKAFFPSEALQNIPPPQAATYVRFSKSTDDSFVFTETESTDFDTIKQTIRDACKQFNVKSVELDPWNCRQMHQELEKQRVPAVIRPQSKSSLNEATKLLERLMIDGDFEHDGSNVLVYCMRNATLETDNNGTCSVQKDINAPQDKIDCVKAIISAIAGYIHGSGAKINGLSKHNIRILG